MSYQKNDVLTVKIEDMGHDGEGIGKCEGYTLFVKDTVIGDLAEVKVIKAKKNYGYARLMRLIEPSPHRVEPICPVARPCGGCQLQMLDYAEQLRFKEKKIAQNLQRIGGMTEIPMEPIVGMESPFRYRNKAQFPIGQDKNGKLITGFYAGRTHQIMENRNCYLGVEQNEEILNRILAWMEENSVSAYQEETGKGLVRHVLIRFGFTTKEIMVCLVVNGKKLPAEKKLIQSLTELEGMTSITLSVNRERTNVIMGKEIRCLWGQEFITDYIGKVKYQISPLSFYQVNPVQTEKLYSLALEYAGLTGEETVWDLYCGIGTISLFLAQKAKKVYGVEIVPENVKYPQGAEKMQIKAITNREVKPGGLPSGVGCNVISTQTAYAIYRACYEGMPSIERVLTVAGSAMGDKSYNLQCRFGTPFSYIVEQCGGFVVEPKKIVLGGPMMGLIATNLEAPNIKGTAGILFFTDKEDRSVENPTCIHCGKCLTVCPMKLEPLYMYKYFQNRDFENMQKYHILDCFECGSCSYNCPGRLPLTHTFKTAKLLFAARAAEEKARAEAAAKEAETK